MGLMASPPSSDGTNGEQDAFRIMVQRYSVLACLLLSMIFFIVASLVYPGGSISDSQSPGFDWSKNFISNLFDEKAINGHENVSRIWALVGIAFHALAYGLFFIRMSKKVSNRHSEVVLRGIGIINILFTFLIATPLHDLMIILSSTLFLTGLFYLTVSIMQTRLNLFKFACIICLLAFYYTLFLYGTGDLKLLAIMQKVSFIGSMVFVIGLDHFTSAAHFQHVQRIGDHADNNRKG